MKKRRKRKKKNSKGKKKVEEEGPDLKQGRKEQEAEKLMREEETRNLNGKNGTPQQVADWKMKWRRMIVELSIEAARQFQQRKERAQALQQQPEEKGFVAAVVGAEKKRWSEVAFAKMPLLLTLLRPSDVVLMWMTENEEESDICQAVLMEWEKKQKIKEDHFEQWSEQEKSQ